MTDSDRKIFFKNCINMDASLLLWYDNLENRLRPLSESPHVEFVNAAYSGRDIQQTQYAMSNRFPTRDTIEGHPERFLEFVYTIREYGYDNTRNPKVRVVIDGRGRFIVTDGLHRSSTMYCLGNPFVCEIIYRDVEWCGLRHHLYKISDECRLYQPIEHLDFAGWPSWRHDTYERISVINSWLLDNLPNAKTGLDFGCHTGNIAIGLSNKNRAMVGVDSNYHAIAAASVLAKMDNSNAKFFSVDDLENDKKFDFTICLSVLNHYASNEARWEHGKKLFLELCAKTDTIFYDCPAPQDPVGGNTVIASPQGMSEWLIGTGAKGSWNIVAERSDKLQRTIMVWRNGNE